MIALVSSLALAHGPGAVPLRAQALDEATWLQPDIDAAADEFGVPRAILSAMVWEACHYDPAVVRQWAGYGPLDLRDGQEPDVERAAILLGVSADLLIADPRHNLRGGAALLADHAARANGGVLPDPDLLEAWWPAVEAFSGAHDPVVQRMYAEYVFETVWAGVEATVPTTGEVIDLDGVPVDLPGLLAAEGVAAPALPDYPGAVAFVPACSSNYSNYSRSGSDIRYVVIHDTEGSYAGSISWFQNCSSSVSAHYIVRSSDGEITQMVAEEDVAWHAGNWTYNEESIGIEHEGYMSDPETWYTDAMYQASAALVADLLTRTDVLPDRNHVIAHSEVPGATHLDPGPGWDWDYYMALIEGTWAITGDLTGVVAIEDIFTGERIVGATVTIDETGESTVTDEDGEYLFEDLPEGTYTVRATAPGYAEGTCEKTIEATGTWWCSIALFPAPETPGGTTTGGTTGGTGTTPITPPAAAGFAPGTGRVPLEQGGCGCASGGAAGALPVLLALALVRRRR